jgi:signal transduction histidine kinase
VLLIKTLRSSTLKLAFLYVTGFSSAIFAVLGFVYWDTIAYVHERTDRAIAAENDALINAYAAKGKAGLIALIDRRTADSFFAEWVYLLVDSSLHHVAGNLARWPPSLRHGHGTADIADLARPGHRATSTRVAYRVLPDGYHLLVGRKAEDLERFRGTIAASLASAGGLFLLLAAAAGISTSRRSVARIEAINTASRRIIETGLHERIPLRGTRDEWDELARNLNFMLDRIEELVESNRQVSDNVAHDLRTPLTRMRGRLEKAAQQSLGQAQHQALIADIILDLDAILKTFTALLRIAQIEARDRTSGFRPVDLAAIAREVVELFDPIAEESQIVLRHTATSETIVVGDRDLLFDALSNLVDNAIRHGGGSDDVTVSVSASAIGPVLAVADHGPGIPKGEHKHVLQRFYRLERSRNSPGNGLGLSLVAAVAKLHAARIEMADNAPGLRLEIWFPCMPSVAADRVQPAFPG